MQLSTWLDRLANYQRGNTRILPTPLPHVVKYREEGKGKRIKTQRFETDAQMQTFIDAHRRIEDRYGRCLQRGDWAWFECSMDNVVITH